MEFMHRLLQNISKEIKSEGENHDQASKVINTYDTILDFANCGRREGLLELEEMASHLDMNDEAKSLFASQITMVVDGTEPKIVKECGINDFVARDLNSYEGLCALMYYRGSLMIQCGENLRVIEMVLKSMIPVSIRKELESREIEKNISQKEDKQKAIDDLCNDEKDINEKDHSVVNQTAISFVNMSDGGMQRLLREVNCKDIALMLKGLPGKARKRVFDNVSSTLGYAIYEDMKYMGPVRLRDVETICADIMKILVKLADNCEIDFDVSILKIVLDVYENSEKNREELRVGYKEIRNIIDKIYKD